MRICPICNENQLKGRQRICDSPICREEMRKSWHEEKMAIPDGYLTASQYAKRMGISPRAIQDPRSGWWFVPEDTKVPIQQSIKRKKKRVIYATDKEWDSIVEAASRTKYSTSEFIVRKVLGKKI
jgi:hypothetical protein